MPEPVFISITLGWMLLGIAAGVGLRFVRAPYGRHTNATWGPLIDNALGWFVMEVVAPIVFLACLFAGPTPWSAPVIVMAVLFTFHYANRALVYPARLRTRGKKMPLAIALMSVGFNGFNGFLLGYHLAHFATVDASWLWDPRFLVGLVLFVGGMAVNWTSDTILINLRAPGETGYRIPHGGLFRWVSSPNLLGEIVEWIGYAILCWSLPAAAFAIWTMANLVPRALANHAWYREHFEDYPATRRALVPYVF